IALAEGRDRRDRADRDAPVLKRDQAGPGLVAADEAAGPGDRVDPPAGPGDVGEVTAELLADHPLGGAVDPDLLTDQQLDLAIRLGDLGQVGLAFDVEVEAAPTAHG